MILQHYVLFAKYWFNELGRFFHHHISLYGIIKSCSLISSPILSQRSKYWETIKFMAAGNLFFNILILCLKVNRNCHQFSSLAIFLKNHFIFDKLSTKHPSLSHLIQNLSAELSYKTDVHKKVAGTAHKLNNHTSASPWNSFILQHEGLYMYFSFHHTKCLKDVYIPILISWLWYYSIIL